MLGKFTTGVAVIALILAVNSTVSAAVPSSLLATGTTRYGVVSTTALATTSSTTFVNLGGLSTSFTIPSGKTGDVIILVCADLWTGVNNSVSVRALIGTDATFPLSSVLGNNKAWADNSCVNFYKTGLTPGFRTAKIQWQSSTGVQVAAYERSMIMIVNLH